MYLSKQEQYKRRDFNKEIQNVLYEYFKTKCTNHRNHSKKQALIMCIKEESKRYSNSKSNMKKAYEYLNKNGSLKGFDCGNGYHAHKSNSDNFYRSREWRELRVKALVKYGRKCCLCGMSVSDGIILHVDHIKPRSKHPELELKLSNLQVLCQDCNLGKSNRYSDKWR